MAFQQRNQIEEASRLGESEFDFDDLVALALDRQF